MRWYLGELRRCVVFSGRSPRRDLFLFVSIHYVVASALAYLGFELLGMLVGEATVDAWIDQGWASATYLPAVVLPLVAATVRRLHDTGRAGWWFGLLVVPLGVFVLAVFLLTGSQPGENRYGPAPTP